MTANQHNTQVHTKEKIVLLITTLLTLVLVLGLFFIVLKQRQHPWFHQIDKEVAKLQLQINDMSKQQNHWQDISKAGQKDIQQQREQFDAYRIKSLKMQQETLANAMQDVRKQITTTLNTHTQQVNERIDKLTKETQQRLKEISQEVDKQLTKGFQKTTETFTDILKRLTIIDQAQKKITELSTNVVSLQEILADKRSRGAFGEVQLNNLIRNMLPEKHYSLQYTLSNGKRADCILFLPQPTGNIVIDSKFPLENYRQAHNENLTAAEKKQAEQLFRQDIKKHINDISEKYIIENETADGAVMFIPAEAIFADIHAHYPDLIDYSQRKRVWLVSPTTMMAVITTARAVLKDEATRKQVHVIQEHLIALSKDFSRFQKRMDNLARHIDQAHEDVSLVHKSSQKISSRFEKIEQVEFKNDEELNALKQPVEETTA